MHLKLLKISMGRPLWLREERRVETFMVLLLCGLQEREMADMYCQSE